MHVPREDRLPWFRQFWPWFLISIPAGTVLAALYTITLAIDSNDGLVKDDYYKEGLAVHRDAAQVQAAQRLGLHAMLDMDEATGQVSVKLNDTVAALPELTLALTHPTRSHQDQRVALRPAGDGRYVGRVAALAPANWRLSLEPPAADWRLSGRLSIVPEGVNEARAELR